MESPASGGGNDAQLIRRFLARDPDAVRRVESLVARIVGSKGYYVPRDERRDLTQKILLQLWQDLNRPGFALRKGFEALVRTIAHRRSVDWLRRQRPAGPVSPALPDHADRPDRALLDKEERELGLRVFGELREACRELMRLHAREELTYREIGERLGRSEVALRVQMHECLKQARQILDRIRGGAEGRAER